MADLIKGLLYLILGLLAIGLILIALIWAFYGVIYLIIIGISVLLVLGNPEKWGKNTDFNTNISLIGGLLLAGLLALIPTIIFIATTGEQETVKIPEGSVLAGFQCGLILCIILLGISVYYKIVNKIFNMGYDNYTLLIVSEILTLLQGVVCSFSIYHLIIGSQTSPFLPLNNYLYTICLAFVFPVIAFFYKLYSANKKYFLYKKGDRLYDQQRYEEAIAEYNKAFELEGAENFYYYYAVGLAYKDMGNNKQAKQMLNKALSIQDYPECYYALADVCLNLGDYKDGLTHIDNLLNKLEKDSKKYKECEQFKTEYIAKKENFEQERKIKRAEELYHEAMNHKGFCEYGKAKKSIKQAIELVPDNENYKKLLEDVQKLYKEEKAKIDNLYNNAVSLKEENKYKQALNTIKDGISLANKQGMSVSDFETLKKEVTSIIDKLEQAEEKYNTAVKLYRAKEYSNAIFNLEKAVSLAPYEVKYQNKLEEIKQEWDNKKAQAEELYFEAKSNFQTNDLNSALSNINKALELINDSRYSSLKADIEREQQKIINEQKAEELYKEAENLYNSGSNKYDRIVELLESANKKYSKAKYQDFLKKVKSERDTIQAENFYKNAKEKFANNEYESATFYITEAIKLSPSNRVYLDFKQKISWDRNKYESDQYAEKLYKTGVKAYNDGDFTNAADNLTKACNVKPDNEEWQKVLEKAKTGKIDIMYCSKKGLLTLDFIDDNIAEQIIKSRNDGNMWYGYEEFAQVFSFQPHQYPDIEEKIAFPLKKGNKYGRRLDV